MGQLGHGLVPMWDVDATGEGITYSVTVLAPTMVFLCKVDHQSYFQAGIRGG